MLLEACNGLFLCNEHLYGNLKNTYEYVLILDNTYAIRTGIDFRKLKKYVQIRTNTYAIHTQYVRIRTQYVRIRTRYVRNTYEYGCVRIFFLSVRIMYVLRLYLSRKYVRIRTVNFQYVRQNTYRNTYEYVRYVHNRIRTYF